MIEKTEVGNMIDRPKYVDQIMRYVDTPFVKILTGVRRCGKSTILNLVMERLRDRGDISAEQIVSYRFDSMEYEDLTAKQMYAELKGRLSKGGRPIFFLDEVQEIIGWEKGGQFAGIRLRCRSVRNRVQLSHDVLRDCHLPDWTLCCIPYFYTLLRRVSNLQGAVRPSGRPPHRAGKLYSSGWFSCNASARIWRKRGLYNHPRYL